LKVQRDQAQDPGLFLSCWWWCFWWWAVVVVVVVGVVQYRSLVLVALMALVLVGIVRRRLDCIVVLRRYPTFSSRHWHGHWVVQSARRLRLLPGLTDCCSVPVVVVLLCRFVSFGLLLSRHARTRLRTYMT
jgi:hypothetical protein